MRLILFTRDAKYWLLGHLPTQRFPVQQIDYISWSQCSASFLKVIILLNSDSLLRERLNYS